MLISQGEGEGDSHVLLALLRTAGRAMWRDSNPVLRCVLSYRHTRFDCSIKI